jgi:GNAT superfamily N-acetyltransferase
MSDLFRSECNRPGATELVTEACCREKTAYFILGAGSTTVGYVAAEVQANRRAKRLNESICSEAGEDEAEDNIPTIIQLYVEPEFRRRGYATEALKLLMREHHTVRVDSPSAVVIKLLACLDFAPGHTQPEAPDGQVLTTFVRTDFLGGDFGIAL